MTGKIVVRVGYVERTSNWMLHNGLLNL